MNYNGYKNWDTWNVALWLSNDKSLYRAVVTFMKSYDGEKPYTDFIKKRYLCGNRTPDGVRFLSKKVDYAELNRVMFDLKI